MTSVFRNFLVLLTAIAFTCSAFAGRSFPNLQPLPSPPQNPKMNLQLEKLIYEAQNAKEDLRDVFILGIAKTTVDVDTEERAAALFQDRGVVIRTLVKASGGNIITFEASVQGVLNAAASHSVISIQMSKRIDGTAGITIRN